MDGVLQPLRAYEHWLAQYKRVWRGTIGTSLVNPILYVTALGPTIDDARSRAYDAAARITWPGVYYRRDIAASA